MAYVDLNSVQNPSAGATVLSAWGDQARDNFVAVRNPYTVGVNNGFETIADSTAHDVIFANQEYDNDAMWDPGSPTLITFTHAGRYLLIAQTEWDINSSGRRFTQFFHSTDGSIGETDLPPSAGSKTSYPTVIKPRAYSAGQTVKVVVYQTSGGNLSCLVAASALWVGEP